MENLFGSFDFYLVPPVLVRAKIKKSVAVNIRQSTAFYFDYKTVIHKDSDLRDVSFHSVYIMVRKAGKKIFAFMRKRSRMGIEVNSSLCGSKRGKKSPLNGEEISCRENMNKFL